MPQGCGGMQQRGTPGEAAGCSSWVPPGMLRDARGRRCRARTGEGGSPPAAAPPGSVFNPPSSYCCLRTLPTKTKTNPPIFIFFLFSFFLVYNSSGCGVFLHIKDLHFPSFFFFFSPYNGSNYSIIISEKEETAS